MKLNVGDKLKTEELATATVTDKHWQVDKNKVPYMLKTEFIVKNVKTFTEEKAVVHTYLTTTCFMIQGKGKDFFYENVMKDFIESIMKENLQEI